MRRIAEQACPAAAPETSPLEGQSLGSYRLGRMVGQGAMASVYEAFSVSDERVAIKILHTYLAADPSFVERLATEARLGSRVHAENLVKVLGSGEHDGLHYFVMEFLEGASLERVMWQAWLKGSFDPGVASRIIRDAARGIGALHEQVQVVHLDICPENLMVLRDGTSKVIDLGIARACNGASGAGRGRPAYCAPEVITGADIDHRADLWSLGVVLWELSTGYRLFRGENEIATLKRVVDDPIPPPSTFVSDLSSELEQTIMRCLEREQSKRFASANELSRAIDEYLSTVGS